MPQESPVQGCKQIVKVLKLLDVGQPINAQNAGSASIPLNTSFVSLSTKRVRRSSFTSSEGDGGISASAGDMLKRKRQNRHESGNRAISDEAKFSLV